MRHLNEFEDDFDYVITVCDQAAKACPAPPPSTVYLHWSFEDPAAAQGTLDEQRAVFQRVRDGIAEQLC
jgi:arsenate reductase